ncbi:hypothetical protein [Streptomyces sp. UG1]|uniref:hypothetical protein n=1 Tax=Streptomyces sp. UG1 TaxID=3417652 RepID=UPI003CE7E2A6
MTVRTARTTLVAATAVALSVGLAAPALAAAPAGDGHQATRDATPEAGALRGDGDRPATRHGDQAPGQREQERHQ